jgi:hypothetical protein
MQINNEKLRGENSIHYIVIVFGLYVIAWRFCKLANYFNLMSAIHCNQSTISRYCRMSD